MEITDERDSGFDQAHTDHVSARIRLLAIAMIVIFVVFATLDWCDLLPPLPAAAVAGTALDVPMANEHGLRQGS
jgi:hypothetical protein